MSKTVHSKLLQLRHALQPSEVKTMISIVKTSSKLLRNIVRQGNELFITNLDRKLLKGRWNTYCMVLDEHKIELFTMSLFKKIHMSFDFDTADFYQDGHLKPLDTIDLFFDKIQGVLSDLEGGRAAAYTA